MTSNSIRTVCAIAALLMACVGVCLAQPAPVASFSFDEGQGYRAADASSFAHRGIVRSPQWVAGKVGGALSFSSPTSGVRVSCRRQLKLATQLSISAWIKPSAEAAREDLSRIVVAKNDEYLLRIDKPSEGGRLSFFVHVGSPAVSWEPRVSSKAPLEPELWHHVVVVWDGAMLRMYVDGELHAERERVGAPNPNPYPVMIGNFEYPSCHGANFGGALDEVRIYGQALTAQQAQELSR